MCNHDDDWWELLSRFSDGTGDVYEYWICRLCGEEETKIIDELNR